MRKGQYGYNALLRICPAAGQTCSAVNVIAASRSRFPPTWVRFDSQNTTRSYSPNSSECTLMNYYLRANVSLALHVSDNLMRRGLSSMMVRHNHVIHFRDQHLQISECLLIGGTGHSVLVVKQINKRSSAYFRLFYVKHTSYSERKIIFDFLLA